ncbi:MAG: flagellar motor switch protein FliG [Candidatus Cloacimonetes bacterium]|nr:flagellar motor switch protein FliG [Candidatus Cloacimonadota bacterium]
MNFEFKFDKDQSELYQNMLKGYDGLTKTAILMIGLGKEASSVLFKELPDTDVEKITIKIATTQFIEPKITEAVFEEFYEMIKAQEFISLGGVEYARDVLEGALGDARASEIIKKIQRMLQVTGFNVLKKVDATQLMTFIQKEHPQTIALILTQLEPIQAANVLGELPEELRNDVVVRFASMERVSQEMISHVEQIIEERIDFSQQGTQFGGVRAAAEIINLVGSTVEKSILEAISIKDPKLAQEIKNLMFVFEDIVYLEDRTIQNILKDVDQRDLVMALKSVEEDVQAKIFKNISVRAATIIREEMDYTGPVKLKDVETAQQNILDIIRKKEETGEIQLSKGTEEFV